MVRIIVLFTIFFIVLVACDDEDTRRVSVEDVFNKTEAQAMPHPLVDKSSLEPIQVKAGEIKYGKAKNAKERKREYDKARKEAFKVCNGDFTIIRDDYRKNPIPKNPSMEYRCGE